MTLIVTSVADDAIVQVSDRRLTLPNGEVFADDAMKTICLACADASLSISYTGLARVGAKHTDHWLVDQLVEARAAEMTHIQVVHALASRARLAFSGLRNLGSRRALTIAVAGFGPPGPFWGFISNFEDADGRRLKAVGDDFTWRLFKRKKERLRRAGLMINGVESAVSALGQMVIRPIRRRYLELPPERRITMSAQLIRLAASCPQYGGLIGRDCVGVAVLPSGEFRSAYLPEHPSPIEYSPHYISRGFAVADVWFATEPADRPPWAGGPRR